MKVLINRCFGGFGFSDYFVEEYHKRTGTYISNLYDDSLSVRTSNDIIELVEKIGPEKSSGGLSKLKIVEVPDDVEWEIHEYDGMERIHEKHRAWE